MMIPTAAAILFSTLASTAYAHMEMTSPPPLRSKVNPNVQNADFDMVSPLAASGANFPCKGYLVDLGTAQGAATADFPAGSTQQVTITGGAAHNGGSCQFALSYDNGASFKVIQSNIGNCVNPSGTSSFPVSIPAEAQSGDAVFAWIWHNNTGNREIYMNCAAVTISGSGTSNLSDRPDIFVANLATTTCAVPEGTDVIFPNPGANVVQADSGRLGAPTGDCGAVGAAPPAPAPPAAPPAAPAPPSEPAPQVPAPAPAPAPPAAGGVTYTVVSGDICDTIAAQNGVTVAALLAANPNINATCSNLAVGQVLSLRRRSRIMRSLA